MTKKSNRGFTLVELLAVIVILAIILVIAVPKIMTVITDSKKSTLETSAKMIASTAEKTKVQKELLGEEITGTVNCSEFTKVTSDYESCTVKFDVTTAKVNIAGSGKFDGLSVCNGTKNNAEAIEGSCPTYEQSLYLSDNSLILVNRTTEYKAGDTFTDKEENESEIVSVHGLGESAWTSIRESVTKVVVEDIIQPSFLNNWFYYFKNCSYFDLEKLDTSNVTTMYRTFFRAGSNTTIFEIKGLDNWDTSKVDSMYEMFYETGYNATTWSVGDLSKWNVSNVYTMSSMFDNAGFKTTTFDIDLSNWDTSKVRTMNSMFKQAGRNATTWSIGDLSNWDTSKVTDMYSMFANAGEKATAFNIGNLSNWKVSNVTNLSFMFSSSGYNATTWSIGDLSNWDTSKVTNMSYMFEQTGYNAKSFILDLSKWNTSKVTDMEKMFKQAGYNSTTWSIGDLSNWDTSKVTGMYRMFEDAGYKADYTLVLSDWNVSNVMDYEYFNEGVTSKITPPNFTS